MTELTETEIQELVKQGREALLQVDAFEGDFKGHPSEYAWKKMCQYKERVKEIRALLGDKAHMVGENMYPGTHP